MNKVYRAHEERITLIKDLLAKKERLHSLLDKRSDILSGVQQDKKDVDKFQVFDDFSSIVQQAHVTEVGVKSVNTTNSHNTTNGIHGAKDTSFNEEHQVIEYEDYDGLGLIGAPAEPSDEPTDDIQDKALSLDNKNDTQLAQQENSPKKPSVPMTKKQVSPILNMDSIIQSLNQLENYSLSSPHYLFTLPILTTHLQSQLKPYYSPAHTQREEYQAEIASFVALRTLAGYASVQELASGMRISSVRERLNYVHGIMRRHLEELKCMKERLEKELEGFVEDIVPFHKYHLSPKK